MRGETGESEGGQGERGRDTKNTIPISKASRQQRIITDIYKCTWYSYMYNPCTNNHLTNINPLNTEPKIIIIITIAKVHVLKIL